MGISKSGTVDWKNKQCAAVALPAVTVSVQELQTDWHVCRIQGIMPQSEGIKPLGGENAHILPIRGSSLCEANVLESNTVYPRNSQTELVRVK